MSITTSEPQILSRNVWQALEEEHRRRIYPWIAAFRQRRERRLTHPVHDFLFEYYQCKRRLVTEWHPPLGAILEGNPAHKYLKSPNYSQNNCGVYLDPTSITEAIVNRIEWIQRLLESAQLRCSQTTCYGLHEWAMVYKSESIRHSSTSLRLDPEKIEAVIESNTIRCTHYDAFRFFTDEARPRNSIQPNHEERRENEQFGCVHFNMDLFKWCYKLSPWISSELMLDCFYLAVEARELDMRASPYDLRNLGYEAIPIETPVGRIRYKELQTQIGKKGRFLASRLLKESCKVLDARSD